MPKKPRSLSVLTLALFVSLDCYAAGFAVQELSVTGQGRAFAGSAAVADDASTVFFNPAGLTYLSQSQINAGLNFISPTGEFINQGSSLPAALGSGAISGAEDDAGQNAFIPLFYYAHRLNKKSVVGLGVNAPFGFVTEYDDDWVGRYHAIKSDLKTININPSIAFKANEKLSVGFGVSLQYADLEITQAVDFGSLCAQTALDTSLPVSLRTTAASCATPQGFDGKAALNAKDWSWGYNLGLIYELSEASRVGLNYRSKISHTLEGPGRFIIPDNSAVQTVAAAGGFTNGDGYGSTSFPESVSFSIHHKINKKWAVSTDATWTRWNRFQELNIQSDNVERLNSNKDESWKNTMRYSIGVDYRLNDTWQLRSGIAYDETPIPDNQHRTARIPGNDRKWFSLGASYTLNERFVIDSAYTYVFASNPKINETSSLGYTLLGEYEGDVHIVAMQLRWLL